MLALDDSRSMATERLSYPAPTRTPRSTLVKHRPHEVAWRRPAGRFVEYGAVPTPLLAPRSQLLGPSKARVRVRVAVAGAVLVVVLAGVVFGLASFAGSAASAVPVRTGVVHVHQGETLSELATRVAPGVPRSALVPRIVQLNALDGVSVRAGQALVVPLGG